MENTAQAFKLYTIFSAVKETNSVQEKQTHQHTSPMDQQGNELVPEDRH